MDILKRAGLITLELEVSADWQQRVYLFSDVHFDSAYCRREMIFLLSPERLR